MKISVAMATYNGAEFIIEQLESIRTQTMAVDQVVICDDQSKDDTVSKIEQYIADHQLNGWSVERNPENLGYASNFVGALRKTDGDYIFFCDQDDIWIRDRVEKMIGLMEDHKDMLLLASEFEPFSDSEDACEVPSWELKSMRGDGSISKLSYNAANIYIGAQGCTMCIRRELMKQIDSYWYKGWAHDEYVWKLALCLDGLYMYHQPTIRRRLHASNASLQKSHDLNKRMKYLTELLPSHEATLQFALDHKLTEKQCKLLARNVKATKLRIRQLTTRNFLLTIPLFCCYRDCYHKSRAIPVECLMAIKGH